MRFVRLTRSIGYIVQTKILYFQLTLADLALHVYIEHTEAHVAPSDRPLLNNYTRLAENRRNTERIPKIRDYLANRPHTDL
ncbi:hypothetical protein DPMN_004989 [Dreissena polymorpha]|uniref:Glutathione S-transferase C-terminal domain-containing protein n=1 Tax=Dreissena polymorpha TaxID=45954 RepID=A0A9D4MRU0_DREPO|nr:hypothetical protein DPMN_004989 [Dreissena polymorpha]